jgi:HlyD family secretion protein
MTTSETTSQSDSTSPGVTWWQRNARRIWLMARVVGVVAVIGLAAWWMLLSPVVVSTHTVTREDVLAEVLGTGTLEARVSAIVGPKIPGLIVKIAVDQGDHVKAGDTLIHA